MFIPKKYGESQIKRCPWCEGIAITSNSQKVPVCMKHKNNIFENVKCGCGKFLDIMHGKFGSFFTCTDCGIVNMKKALEVNQLKDITKTDAEEKKKSKSINVFHQTARNDDMLDLLSTIKTNKKNEQQIVKDYKIKLQQNIIKEEKIPTLFELLDDDHKSKIKKNNNNQINIEKERFDKNEYNKKETIVSSDELDFM